MKTKSLLFKAWLWITLVATINLIVGCHYYKANNLPLNEPQSKEQFNELLAMQKYFILHLGSDVFHVVNLQVDFEKQVITGKLGRVDSTQLLFVRNQLSHQPEKYQPKSSQQNVLNEVHIYLTKGETWKAGDEVSIPFNSIGRVAIVDPDGTRTAASYVFSTLGILTGTFIILIIIVALTKSSCPFVYVYEGNNSHFAGEIFGGAIYPQLERDDFLPLQSDTKEPTHRIRITNELQEKQYTNLAELWVVEHRKGTSAYCDSHGEISVVDSLQPPITASLNDHVDQTKEMQAIDDASCVFSDDQGNLFQELSLTFNKNATTTNGLLVLNLKNTLWLDYMYGEFTRLFGSYYNRWKETQKTLPADSLLSWSKHQGIPMQVSLLTKNGWKEIETIPAIGPLAARTMSVHVPLAEVQGDKVQLKLTCGFMFWEVDYAGFSNAPTYDFTLHKIKPELAVNESSKNVTAALVDSDDKYLEQPSPGSVAEISYTVPELQADNTYSTFLHARGYYDHVRDYKGIPSITKLMEFKKPQSFTAFSKERYMKMYPAEMLSASK